MDDRFGLDPSRKYVVPREIPENGLTLFSIMAVEDSRYLEGWAFFYARHFVITWPEEGRQLQRLFGYRVATPAEMEQAFKKRKLPDDFGHDYLVYKTPILGLDDKLLTDGLTRSAEASSTLIGARHTLIRHVPNAWAEASFYAYKECRKEAEATANRLNLPLQEILHQDIQEQLAYEYETYREIELAPFVVRLGQPPRQKKRVGEPIYKQMTLDL